MDGAAFSRPTWNHRATEQIRGRQGEARSLLPFTAGAWLREQTLWAPELQGPLPSSLVWCLWGAQPHLLATRQRLWPLEEASLQEAGKEAWVRDTPQRARELVTNRPTPTPTVKRGGDKRKHLEPEVGDDDKGGGALWGHLLKSETAV